MAVIINDVEVVVEAERAPATGGGGGGAGTAAAATGSALKPRDLTDVIRQAAERAARLAAH